MSRRELADAINEYLWNIHKRMGTLDAAYVGKLERGTHRWPQDLYREAFRAILSIGSDAELPWMVALVNEPDAVRIAPGFRVRIHETDFE